MSTFEIYYPGKFSDEDKAVLDKYFADLAAVNERGENYSVQDLIGGKLAGQPGISGRIRTIEAYEAKFEAMNYAPDNPKYKQEAFPSFAMSAEFWVPLPESLRDYLVVSGLNHEWKFYNKVYPGDTLYPIAIRQDCVELTIPGSEYRTFGISGTGRVYNQRGELVAEAFDRTKESLRRFADPAKRGGDKPHFWECPAWWERPRHYYTDADWDFIKGVWAKEAVYGGGQVYWEDIEAGCEPPWMANGPVTTLDQVKYHGLGEIGAPELKKRMNGPMFQRMQRDERDGIYYLSMGVGHLDEGRDPNKRAAFYNFMPVNHAVTMLENWMGDAGAVKAIGWRIMNILPGYEDKIPDFPDPNSYIAKVPYLQGKDIRIHGLVGDLLLIKSYVTDKYVKESAHLLDLVWWCETIDGQIYQEGNATVSLPSRG